MSGGPALLDIERPRAHNRGSRDAHRPRSTSDVNTNGSRGEPERRFAGCGSRSGARPYAEAHVALRRPTKTTTPLRQPASPDTRRCDRTASHPVFLSQAGRADVVVRPRRVGLELVSRDRRERVRREVVRGARGRRPVARTAGAHVTVDPRDLGRLRRRAWAVRGLLHGGGTRVRGRRRAADGGEVETNLAPVERVANVRVHCSLRAATLQRGRPKEEAGERAVRQTSKKLLSTMLSHIRTYGMHIPASPRCPA